MGVLVQHGYGKSDKIERALGDIGLRGAIFNPRYETQENLEAYLAQLAEQFDDPFLVVDPHFFLTTFPDAPLGYLPDYPYFTVGLTRGDFLSQGQVGEFVEAVLSYQEGLPVSRLIGPTVFFEDFRGGWAQVALSLAGNSLEYHGGLTDSPGLLASFAFDESALASREALDEFLDLLSTWDLTGFYFRCRPRDQSYPVSMDESSVVNLLYLTYSLSIINRYEVVWGYTDLIGYLIHAVGGGYQANGWFNTQRYLSRRMFRQRSGGQPRNARYTSRPLLNSILVVPELETTYAIGRVDEVLSQTAEDSVFRSGNPADQNWPLPTACLHHWEVCQKLAGALEREDDVSTRLDAVEERLESTLSLYASLDEDGVPFRSETGPRIPTMWLRAVREFRREMDL